MAPSGSRTNFVFNSGLRLLAQLPLTAFDVLANSAGNLNSSPILCPTPAVGNVAPTPTSLTINLQKSHRSVSDSLFVRAKMTLRTNRDEIFASSPKWIRSRPPIRFSEPLLDRHATIWNLHATKRLCPYEM